MLRMIELSQRMTDMEASVQYPDNYIIMGMEGMNSAYGRALYVGDSFEEAMSQLMKIKEPYCGIVEGLNHQRSIGGIVIGG